MNVRVGDLLLILAAAQGYFLTALLFHKYGKLTANRFLAALMLLYSILLTHLFLGETGLPLPDLVQWVVIGSSFLVGPLHYLYARHLVAPATNRRQWLHIIPFVAFSLLSLWAYTFDPTGTTLLARRMLVDYTWLHWTILVHANAYMLATVRLLHRYANAIKQVFSDLHRIRLNWLRNLTLLAFGIMFVYFAENLLLLYNIKLSDQFDLSSLIIAGYVYIIGYLGVFKSEVFSDPVVVESIRQMDLLPPIKYEKSGLSSEKAAAYEAKILDYMQKEKPWLNSELTLGQLAKQLDIPLHYVSEVINSRLGQNFFNFVNQYRLEQVKQDLIDPAKAHLKILAIAFDAGFNSKSSFNQLFREKEGVTPSEYRNQPV